MGEPHALAAGRCDVPEARCRVGDMPKPADVHKQRVEQIPKLQFLNMSPRAPEERTPRKAPLPKTRGEIKHHKPVDRIEQNRVEAQKPVPPKPKARVTKVAKASQESTRTLASVPAYLDQRKRQLQARGRGQKSIPAGPAVSRGHDAHAG